MFYPSHPHNGPDPSHTVLPLQGGGVFCNPASPGAPAKLRVLYECWPLALVVEAAGGLAVDDSTEPMLDQVPI